MTKHRTITGFVAVALLAAATTAATMRSSLTNRAIAPAGMASLNLLTADEDGARTPEFKDLPLGAKKPVRYQAVIDNWKRYRSASKSNEWK